MNRKGVWTTQGKLFLNLVVAWVAYNAILLTIDQQNFVAVAQTSTPSSKNNTGANDLANNDLVRFTVTVLNERGRRITHATGLQQSNFAVFSDGAQQDVVYFSDKDEPASVVVLVDTSGSMMPDRSSVSRLSFIRDAFTNFAQLCNGANEYLLLSFNQSPRFLLEWTPDTRAVLNELARLASEKPKGKTALYEACYLGVERLKTGKHAKRVMILISDGIDGGSESPYDWRKLSGLLRETNVLVYAVNVNGLQRARDDFDSLGEEGRRVLGNIARISGGMAFYPTRESELKDIFDFIAVELRRQYLIGFKAPNSTEDGKWRPIKIKVTPAPNAPSELKRLSARYREGYYAPSKRQ